MSERHKPPQSDPEEIIPATTEGTFGGQDERERRLRVPIVQPLSPEDSAALAAFTRKCLGITQIDRSVGAVKFVPGTHRIGRLARLRRMSRRRQASDG